MAYWQNGKCYPARLACRASRSVCRRSRGYRHQAGRPRLHRRVLRRRLRLEGHPLSDHGDSGAAVEEDQWPSGDDAHQPRRGVRARLRPRRLPGPGQDRLRRERPHHGDGPFRRPGERPEHGLLGLPQLRTRRSGLLPAGSDALARHAGAHQHAAARSAARSRREPDRDGVRAADRQGGARARHRPACDPAHQCARQRRL